MDEFQTVGVQEHPRTGVFTQLFDQFKITVFVIADNRMLDRRTVYADLVCAAGENFHAHGGVTAGNLLNIKLRVCALAFAGRAR